MVQEEPAAVAKPQKLRKMTIISDDDEEIDDEVAVRVSKNKKVGNINVTSVRCFVDQALEVRHVDQNVSDRNGKGRSRQGRSDNQKK
jgi:hypothetical protein